MNKEKLKKLQAEIEHLIPADEMAKLKAKLVKEIKEKEREILAGALEEKLKPLFKKLDIAEPTIDIKLPDLKIGDVAPRIELITLSGTELPPAIVNVPAANITVRPPKVIVKVPPPKITLKPTDVKIKFPPLDIPPFPDEIRIKEFEDFSRELFKFFKQQNLNVSMSDVDRGNPLPVTLIDARGKPFKFELPPMKGGGGGGGGPSVISLKDKIPKGYQKLTVAGSAVALTVPDDSNYAVLVCEDADIRWRDDGTDPDATTGMPLFANQPLALDGALLLSKFKAIRQTNSAVLHIAYYQK